MKNWVKALVVAIIPTLLIVGLAIGLAAFADTFEKPAEPIETAMTVDDVVSKAGTDYFIVKEIDTWAVLEEDVYMDREVIEINICDDVENTLCLFIDLEENEIPRIRKN